MYDLKWEQLFTFPHGTHFEGEDGTRCTYNAIDNVCWWDLIDYDNPKNTEVKFRVVNQ